MCGHLLHPAVTLPVRCVLRITGRVQGVGFRPFVHRLAQEHGLTGFVCNDAAGVTVDAEGAARALAEFVAALAQHPPPLAAIRSIERRELPATHRHHAFRIAASHSTMPPRADITPDAACCPHCLAEMRSSRPGQRRRGHGLITCTHCGPRYSIIQRIPYDRPNTTMARFAMCRRCEQEYTDADDRRFHAQPISCPDCGPQVRLCLHDRTPVNGDWCSCAVERLAAGQILAIKGIGGYHLACRADDDHAVARLRHLKRRLYKPLAVMCDSLQTARRLVELSPSAEAELLSPACPIILAPRRAGSGIAPSVAPASHRLGVMLPATPIQHMLFDRACGRFDLLVMTSANISDEPLVTDDDDAFNRLGPICDALLWHDRPIARPLDDSVLLDVQEARPLPIRRARGYVPVPLPLPLSVPQQGICLGGDLKATIAVVQGDTAVLSQHLGDLSSARAFESFRQAADDLAQLFQVSPRWIAHDLHPHYISTGYAKQLEQALGATRIAVQHHHAHAAAVLAEHGLTGPALAVVCDGTGYGPDHTAWGGELLACDLLQYRRLAHLRPMRLAGADAAATDCRRSAGALLFNALGTGFPAHPAWVRLFEDPADARFLAQMICRDVRCTPSSAAGRLFDGIAALIGVATHNRFEGEAPMALESAAAAAPDPAARPPLFSFSGEDPVEIDLSPLVRELLEAQNRGAPASELAALFHEQLAAAWEATVVHAAGRTGLKVVALSGGVFCNERLSRRLVQRLTGHGLRVLRHMQVPPGDGGLSLGQAAVAAARLARGIVKVKVS